MIFKVIKLHILLTPGPNTHPEYFRFNHHAQVFSLSNYLVHKKLDNQIQFQFFFTVPSVPQQ